VDFAVRSTGGAIFLENSTSKKDKYTPYKKKKQHAAGIQYGKTIV
jgi:hypothetical protein